MPQSGGKRTSQLINIKALFREPATTQCRPIHRQQYIAIQTSKHTRGAHIQMRVSHLEEQPLVFCVGCYSVHRLWYNKDLGRVTH